MTAGNEIIYSLTSGSQPSSLSAIRISGKGCLKFIPSLFPGFNGNLSESVRKVLLNRIVCHNANRIDDVIWFFFEGPASFTGEDTIEIQSLGFSEITNAIIAHLETLGARQADPGEFSLRSFKNGKMGAKEVLRIINHIEDGKSQRIDQNREHSLVKELSLFRDKLRQFTIEIEADIDFGDRDINPLDQEALISKFHSLEREFDEFFKVTKYQFTENRPLRKLMLIGPSNVGKSAIFNQLLGFDRSLVHDSLGVTRDIVSDKLYYRGFQYEIFDTPGFYKDANELDRKAFERVFEQDLGNLDIWIIIEAGNLQQLNEINWISENIREKLKVNAIKVLANKADLNRFEENDLLKNRIEEVTTMGSLDFKSFLDSSTVAQSKDDSFPFSSFQLKYLQKVSENLKSSSELLDNQEIDLLIAILGDSLNDLSFLLGEHYDLSLTDDIFSKFCLGK